jgi:hypothetical protein
MAFMNGKCVSIFIVSSTSSNVSSEGSKHKLKLVLVHSATFDVTFILQCFIACSLKNKCFIKFALLEMLYLKKLIFITVGIELVAKK